MSRFIEENGEIYDKDHKNIVKDPIKLLNTLDESRKHNKKQRNQLYEENLLLWDMVNGFIAYMKMKFMGEIE